MVRHYLKFSYRALQRQRGYVVINVIGLAIGMACSLMIALYIIHETSFDRYHENKDLIHRVGLHSLISGQEIKAAYISSPVGPAMYDEFPEVASFLRMHIWDETIVQVEDRFYSEPHFALVDSTFFDFFSINLLRGNPQTVLNEPYTVVLSETSAKRLFGDEDPMNKLVRAGGMPEHFRVTGIMEDIPENTHFNAGMLGSFMSSHRSDDNNWLANNFFTYVKLHPGASAVAANNRFDDLIVKYVGPQVREILGVGIDEFVSMGNKYNYFLQPLTDIRLDPSVEYDHQPPKDPKYLWIFGSVGVLILVIASVNFMNLSTAQATKRAKEVGIKKVVGSSRKKLVGQFIAETVLLSFLALIISIVIVEISLPSFNNLLSLNLSLSYLGQWHIIPGMIALAVLVGLMAGSYPAFYLSSFEPVTVLKGKTGSGKQNNSLRLALTILQFVISIMLISGSVIIYRQLNFMLKQDLGFDKENVLVIRRAYVLGGQVNTFKSELESVRGVVSVSSSTGVPGRNHSVNAYGIQGRQDESFLMHTKWVDYDFLETFGIEMAEGRFFDPDMPTDREGAIINERAVRNYGLNDPYATRIIVPGPQEEREVLPVIGVFKDFHLESLQFDISPAMLLYKHDDVHWGYVSIRYEAGMIRSVLDQAEELWASFTANEPLLYYFLDEDFKRLYVDEQQNTSLAIMFTILAIIIASLGLYGLTAFSLQQRIREIGVRKTFGAHTGQIWYMVCKEVMVIVAVATVLAWPLIYWFAGSWLQNYHYRISMNLFDFLVGFLLAVLIALMTISYRVLKTASMNPSISLRYE